MLLELLGLRDEQVDRDRSFFCGDAHGGSIGVYHGDTRFARDDDVGFAERAGLRFHPAPDYFRPGGAGAADQIGSFI